MQSKEHVQVLLMSRLRWLSQAHPSSTDVDRTGVSCRQKQVKALSKLRVFLQLCALARAWDPLFDISIGGA